jgi:hypothetical protein
VKEGVALDTPLDHVVLKRMRQFAQMNKLKKMALMVVGQNLSLDELSGEGGPARGWLGGGARGCWGRGGSSGGLGVRGSHPFLFPASLCRHLPQQTPPWLLPTCNVLRMWHHIFVAGVRPPKPELASPLRSYCLLSPSPFLPRLATCAPWPPGLGELFKSIDTDNSGTITVEEMRRALTQWGNKINEVGGGRRVRRCWWGVAGRCAAAGRADCSGAAPEGSGLALMVHRL